ncbi:VOC family protein [Yinghuangia seranimata]|uniref:VOC family protein n=1 Tax=Yinghuangia seranimata TaxID=408067 RepID=UPI00248BAC9A|nr:VOC family protein [Yinghuangia seranimata]MDI2125695.1 VOC family protein [Yinghuangia seranimata]
MTVRHQPEGYTAVTPWIITRDTAALLDWIGKVFGAQEMGRFVDQDGSIGHAEARIGDAVVMAFDAKPGWPETPAFLRVFVEDAPAVHAAAVAAGGTSVTEVTALFFGDLVGRVRDPFGNLWWIQSHVEDVDEGEQYRRLGDPEFATAMGYVQRSLDEELGARD